MTITCCVSSFPRLVSFFIFKDYCFIIHLCLVVFFSFDHFKLWFEVFEHREVCPYWIKDVYAFPALFENFLFMVHCFCSRDFTLHFLFMTSRCALHWLLLLFIVDSSHSIFDITIMIIQKVLNTNWVSDHLNPFFSAFICNCFPLLGNALQA